MEKPIYKEKYATFQKMRAYMYSREALTGKRRK